MNNSLEVPEDRIYVGIASSRWILAQIQVVEEISEGGQNLAKVVTEINNDTCCQLMKRTRA